MPVIIKKTSEIMDNLLENETLLSEELHEIIKNKYDLKNPILMFCLIKALASLSASYVSCFALSDFLDESVVPNIKNIFTSKFNTLCDEFVQNARNIMTNQK